jgi:hypothetical protein
MTVYTTAQLRALLTDSETEVVYSNNALDIEIYRYAKTK